MKSTLKSCDKYVSHCNSYTVKAISRYSALEGDLEPVIYLFDIQDTDSPKKMQNHVIDRLVSPHEALSESLKALT